MAIYSVNFCWFNKVFYTTKKNYTFVVLKNNVLILQWSMIYFLLLFTWNIFIGHYMEENTLLGMGMEAKQ